jgi:hypothetical protein
MSDDRDQFFNSIFGPQDESSRQLSYENRTVKRVITECGIKPRSWGRLVNICRDETGHPFFSFNWFNSFFQQFPATLSGKRIGYCGTKADHNGVRQKVCMYQLTLADVLKPQKNMLVRALSTALNDSGVDTGRPFVFVFPVVKKMFCAHNLHVDGYGDEDRAQWLFRTNGSSLIVEPSDTLFRALGNDWYQE